MELELDPSQLRSSVETLGSRDYRAVESASQTLLNAGDAGLEAIFWGMNHPHPRVRRGCSDFMDHFGDQRCVDALQRVARHDPVPRVRRSAVHSLGCQRCKAGPLDFDIVAFLVERVLNDDNASVRCEAISAFRWQPRDERAASALHSILDGELHEGILKQTRHTLQFHDPTYHRRVVEEAKAKERSRDTRFEIKE